MASVPAAEAFAAFHRPGNGAPRPPILHGTPGTLITYGLPGDDGRLVWAGVWIRPDGLRFLEGEPPITGPGAAHGLTGASAELFDRYVTAARTFLERIEEVDEELADTQQKGRSVPLDEVWRLTRRIAVLRAQIGRCLVGLAECGRFSESFPGFPAALPAAAAELVRLQELAQGVHQALSDLILLRNAEESNRIAEAANELSRVSNRIASLANTSNIRMLGITYVALVLGLVSAVVLIPNTAATILGMPSAAWVPGLWVDVILVVLAVVPLVLVFSRPWVRVLLASLAGSEVRAAEGLHDLPELTPTGAPEPIPARAPSKRL